MTEDEDDFTLWDPPATRRTDPETSHQAARDAAWLQAANRGLALRLIRAEGPRGMTDYELATASGIAVNSIGVRRGELYRKGYVEKTTMRRPSGVGSAMIVWRAIR